jgi:hypothetical protein
MKNNFFSVKLYEILFPISDEKELETFDSLFLIMEYVPLDLQKLF